MSERTWGGRRAGAGSGGPRPGAGRPRMRFTARPGTIYTVTWPGREPEHWTLVGIQTDGFTFQNDDGETVTVTVASE